MLLEHPDDALIVIEHGRIAAGTVLKLLPEKLIGFRDPVEFSLIIRMNFESGQIGAACGNSV